jgi:hypothetical protein
MLGIGQCDDRCFLYAFDLFQRVLNFDWIHLLPRDLDHFVRVGSTATVFPAQSAPRTWGGKCIELGRKMPMFSPGASLAMQAAADCERRNSSEYESLSSPPINAVRSAYRSADLRTAPTIALVPIPHQESSDRKYGASLRLWMREILVTVMSSISITAAVSSSLGLCTLESAHPRERNGND